MANVDNKVASDCPRRARQLSFIGYFWAQPVLASVLHLPFPVEDCVVNYIMHMYMKDSKVFRPWLWHVSVWRHATPCVPAPGAIGAWSYRRAMHCCSKTYVPITLIVSVSLKATTRRATARLLARGVRRRDNPEPRGPRLWMLRRAIEMAVILLIRCLSAGLPSFSGAASSASSPCSGAASADSTRRSMKAPWPMPTELRRNKFQAQPTSNLDVIPRT